MSDPAPTCSVCGLSCEDRPFAKDAKGRVICRECLDAKKAQRAGPEGGGSDLMSGLLAKSKMAKATPCPNCKSYMPEGTVVCAACGFNTQTGKASTTRVSVVKKESSFKWPFGRKK
ncbi:MAG: hypothetical protein IPJ41_08950 [Phycisphaerales bacterium]|nr:hypothetical protein [Phycisphaerales bacterium]